jgi:outer membrane protein assembly factor BamB
MSYRTAVLVCVAALTAAPAFAQTKPADWPQWRGPDRTGVSPEKGLLKEWPESGPPLLWTAVGMGRGFGSVAVSNGRIYAIGDTKGREQSVVCVNAADGKVVWTAPVGKGDGARNTPTVDGDRVYCLNTQGNQHAEIVCLSTAGKEVWRKDFQKDFNGKMMSGWGYSESPLVDGDKVICTPGGADATLVALDKKTGAVIWKAAVPNGDAAGYASIVVSEGGGVRQYIMLLERGIVGVAAQDGKFLWRYNRIANGTANIPTALVRGDYVFCSTGYGTGAALLKLSADGSGGVKATEQYFLRGNTFQNHHGGMVLLGDHVYAGHGHNNGFPICVELMTGKVVWGGGERGPGGGSAAICAADGMLYFRYEKGAEQGAGPVVALIEASPAGYRLKGQFTIPRGSTPSWQHPVISGGRLYLRDQDRLLCYDVKAK